MRRRPLIALVLAAGLAWPLGAGLCAACSACAPQAASCCDELQMMAAMECCGPEVEAVPPRVADSESLRWTLTAPPAPASPVWAATVEPLPAGSLGTLPDHDPRLPDRVALHCALLI